MCGISDTLNTHVGIYIHIYLQIVMESSLARDVLSRHKPRSWSITMPHTEVLQELADCSPEFITAKRKIGRVGAGKVCRVFRVENPFLYGEYNIEVSSSFRKLCSRRGDGCRVLIERVERCEFTEFVWGWWRAP